MSPAYTIPPGFIGLAFAIAAIVVAYYYGFSSGYTAGRNAGYGDGMREGARYGEDRGRQQDGGDGDDAPRRGGLGIAALILAAIAFVILTNRPRDSFSPSLSPSIDSHGSTPSRLLDEPSIDSVTWPQESRDGFYRTTPEYEPGDLLDEPSID